MRRLALIALTLSLAFARASSPAGEVTWLDFYLNGLAATQRNDWAAVASEMQRAVALKPGEELSARSKEQIITYVPHFWLGIARYNIGDTEGALRELHLSESQGVIQQTQYASQLRAWISRAEAEKLHIASEQAAPNRKGAEAAINRALGAQADSQAVGGDHIEGFRTGQKKLQQALAQFNKGGNDPKAFDQVADLANQARTSFIAASDQAKADKAARALLPPKPKPAPPVVPPPVTVTQTQATATVPVVVVEPPKPAIPIETPAHVGARVALQNYRRSLDETVRTASAPTAAYARGAKFEAERWQQALDGKIDDKNAQAITAAIAERQRVLAAKVAAAIPVAPPSSTIAVVAPPSNAIPGRKLLGDAYAAYAAGSLVRAEAILDPLVSSSRSADAFALRACVRYTHAMVQPAARSLLDGARSDFNSALAINPSLTLDKRVFSPKLIAFFQDVRRARQAAR